MLLLSMIEIFRQFLAELKMAAPLCSDIAWEADFEER
jgi:hypothetical protein